MEYYINLIQKVIQNISLLYHATIEDIDEFLETIQVVLNYSRDCVKTSHVFKMASSQEIATWETSINILMELTHQAKKEKQDLENCEISLRHVKIS